MNIRSQIVIDKYIIQVFAILLNIITRAVGKLFRINHALDRNFKRIAVCKYKGMGSIIQATPMLYALKEKYPEAEIIFVSSIQNKAILKKIDIIDSYILLNDKSFFKLLFSLPRFIFWLIRKRIQLFFDLEIYSNFSSIVTLFSLSTNRIGYYLRSSNYRLGIYTHMLFYNMRLPIYQVYLQMARLLNIDEKEYSLYKLPYPDTSIKLENNKEFDLKKENYIIINPNASDLRVERRWTTQGFIELINILSEKHPDYSIFLIGSPTEYKYTKNIFELCKQAKNVENLAGKTSINEIISLIANANLMVTNDTGPMHIGFSLNTPIVALFGPCMPIQYGNQANSISVHKNVYCSPCVHEFVVPPCKGDNVCMQQITVKEVVNAVKQILAGNNKIEIHNNTVLFLDESSPLGVVSRA